MPPVRGKMEQKTRRILEKHLKNRGSSYIIIKLLFAAEAGLPCVKGGKALPAALRGYDEAVFVTTREIDAQVRELARVIGYGVNFALQNLTVEEITSLLQ